MKVMLTFTMVAALALSSGCLLARQMPTIEPSPLGADQLLLYRSFLATYNNGSHSILNIANITEPFSPLDGDRTGCLKGFPSSHTSVVHRFPSSAFKGVQVRMVDPRLHQKRDPGDATRNGESVDDAVNAGFASGIFTFSEVVFNPSHDRAAFTFSFVCGGLCGNGGTVIFQRKDGKWVQEKDRCGSWIS